MDVALENLTRVSTEGARQWLLLNLSGKRTEKVHTDIGECLFILVCSFQGS